MNMATVGLQLSRKNCVFTYFAHLYLYQLHSCPVNMILQIHWSYCFFYFLESLHLSFTEAGLLFIWHNVLSSLGFCNYKGRQELEMVNSDTWKSYLFFSIKTCTKLKFHLIPN